MYILRRILVFLASVSFGLLLLLLVSTTVFRSQIGDSERVKSWLQTSGVYDNFTAAVLEQSADASANTDGAIPLGDPELIAKAKQAFNAPFLQTTTEAVLDGIFAWLNGETFEPKFILDFSGPKKEFARLVSEFAVERYQRLPACSAGNLPTSVDPFNDKCKIATLGTEKIGTQIQEEIANNKDIFGQTAFTAASFPSKNNPSKNIFEDLAVLPKVFIVLRAAPFFVGLLLLFAVLIIVFADKSKQKGLRKVGVGLLVNGFLVLVFTFASPLLFNNINKRLNETEAGNSAVITKVVSPLVETANKDIAKVTLIFGIVYMALGFVLLLSLFFYKRRGVGNHHPDSHRTPVPPSQTSAVWDDKQLPPDPIASPMVPTAPQIPPAFRSYEQDGMVAPRKSQASQRVLPTPTTRSRSRRTLIQ